MAQLDLRSNAEPEDAPPRLAGCPHCRRLDAVQRVPMAAEHREDVRKLAATPGSGRVERRARRLEGPVPRVRYGWKPLVVAVGTPWTVAMGLGMLNGNVPAKALVELIVAGGLTWVNALGVIGMFKRRKRVRGGAAAALAVWNEGWFCNRCGVAYFQPGYEPAGVGLHQSLTLSEFRREVYRAGGYGDLAEEAEPGS